MTKSFNLKLFLLDLYTFECNRKDSTIERKKKPDAFQAQPPLVPFVLIQILDAGTGINN